jgi:hypothetical protein
MVDEVTDTLPSVLMAPPGASELQLAMIDEDCRITEEPVESMAPPPPRAEQWVMDDEVIVTVPPV